MTKVDIRDYLKANNIDERIVTFEGEEYIVVNPFLSVSEIDGKEYICVDAIKNTDIFVNDRYRMYNLSLFGKGYNTNEAFYSMATKYDLYKLFYPMTENDKQRFECVPFSPCTITDFDCSSPAYVILNNCYTFDVLPAPKSDDNYDINNAYVIKSISPAGGEVFWTAYVVAIIDSYYY